MKLLFEAAPEDYHARRDEFVKALTDGVSAFDPQLADVLEKALPPHEPNLKWRVLQDLHKQTTKQYQARVQAMLADIDNVLERSFQKAEGDEPPEYKTPEQKAAEMDEDEEGNPKFDDEGNPPSDALTPQPGAEPEEEDEEEELEGSIQARRNLL